ncbi:MAG: universal stress protein, partial [Deltaproteobacteria bacterium]|nr:universal stress protein [Deltaproteobacteria bacterium]
MKILLGYNGSEAAKAALSLARDHAKTHNAMVYVITSMEGGSK